MRNCQDQSPGEKSRKGSNVRQVNSIFSTFRGERIMRELEDSVRSLHAGVPKDDGLLGGMRIRTECELLSNVKRFTKTLK